MLPDDDSSIEIIDQNNNSNNEDEEMPKKPDEEDSYKEQVFMGYQVIDEQNVKEQKVLVSENNVAQKIITLDVPLLCDVVDIITTIFGKQEIMMDDFGYKIVNGNKVQRITARKIEDPSASYQFAINTETLIERQCHKTIEVEDDDDDCCVIDQPKDYSPPVNATEKLPENLLEPSSPKSIDSQETYFSVAEKNPEDQQNDEFFSCMKDENDIKVKENEKDRATLFAILTDDHVQDEWMKPNGEEIRAEDEGSSEIKISSFYSQAIPERTVEDEWMKSDDEQIKTEDEESKSSNEIATSRFYSKVTPEQETSSSLSRKTVELSDSPVFSKRRSQRNRSKSARETILAVYGGITIYKENYMCLNAGQYLNDLIVDFYLKHLVNEVLSEDDRNRTHVFSSQFFTRLSKLPAKGNSEEVTMSEAERRHLGVQRWTKNVNIFEKDFIIIPIVEHFHWNLAIICYPGLAGMLDDDTENLIRPCILFFDSMYNKGKERIAAILRGYLSEEYLAKMGKSKSFSNSALRLRYPKVPHQSNAYDCGLYVLQYVEQFFKYPITDYTVVPLDLSEWFKKDVIKGKREEIANLISKLAKEYNPDGNVKMPTLCFTSDKESSNEEDSESRLTKKRNPFYKKSVQRFDTTNKSTKDAEGCSSSILKEKKSDKRSSDKMFDSVREGSPSSENPKLSMDWVNTKRKKYRDDDLMDIDEENFHLTLDESDHDNLNDKDGVPLPDLSGCQLNNDFSISSKSSQSTYKNKHKISIIKEDFSGSKSHLFKKSSIFSADSEGQSVNSVRPKREVRPNPISQKMAELASQFREKKKKNELKEKKNAEEVQKKSNTWIDLSDLEPGGSRYSFSVYNADNEEGIPPSTSYKDFKIYKKHVERIQQY